MKNKYGWIAVDFTTIVGGTFITVLKGLDSRPTEIDTALGASLIVLGILIRAWREEFFKP